MGKLSKLIQFCKVIETYTKIKLEESMFVRVIALRHTVCIL